MILRVVVRVGCDDSSNENGAIVSIFVLIDEAVDRVASIERVNHLEGVNLALVTRLEETTSRVDHVTVIAVVASFLFHAVLACFCFCFVVDFPKMHGGACFLRSLGDRKTSNIHS